MTQARIFFEIYENERCTAAHIAQIMNIDEGYLSRIIIRHEKDGYINRLPSKTDGRSYLLYLTEKGKNGQKISLKNQMKKLKQSYTIYLTMT